MSTYPGLRKHCGKSAGRANVVVQGSSRADITRVSLLFTLRMIAQMRTIFALSNSRGGLSFPKTVAALLDAGVSDYHVDYASSLVTTHTPNTITKTITTE